jgi:hypothetical protein
MKTAVTQLIERLKNDWNIVLSDNVVEFYLKEEKDQIINAFGNGEYISFCKDRLDYDPADYKFSNSEEYYDSTYTQSSE